MSTTGRAGRYDVAVIGGGVLGCAIAARIAATRASVCLLEAAGDVAEGASKGNAGIAVSYYGGPGTLETALINRANPGWEELCGRLDVPYRRIGALMVAVDDAEAARLPAVVAEARACGVRAALLDGAGARALEPLVTPSCRAAVHLPDEGIVDPMRLTVAFARLAAANGCDVRRAATVTGIEREHGGRTRVMTAAGAVHARYVVNAAGAAAGAVSRLAGGEPFRVWPRQGQYVLLDREFGRRLRTIVLSPQQPDTERSGDEASGRGWRVHVVPTTHGTCLLGPTATDHDDPLDTATDAGTLAGVRACAARLVPATAAAAPIKVFAANRPAGDERLRVRLDAQVGTLLHATSRSTGVSTAPAVAERALELLRGAGLDAADRPDPVRALPAVPRLRTAPEPERLTAIDPAYGDVVCACEQVSAAEIAAALAGPVGARSIGGLRKRTGASGGRCQGAMCIAGLTAMCTAAAAVEPRTVAGSAGR